MKRLCLPLIFLALAVGCSGLIMDRSIPSVEAHDLTLTISACSATPTPGFDACRVKEGQAIDSTWRLFFPDGVGVLSGEVMVMFKDVTRQYAVNSNVVEIPWADFFDDDVWRLDYDGYARALGVVRFKDKEGIERTAKFRGEARVLVLKEGYDPMPIDSGFAGWKTRCRIQWSTAGRSAVECK